MTRKRIAVGLLLVTAFIAVPTIFLIASLPRSKFNRENFACITVGMTQADVEEILGTPPPDVFGNYEYELIDAGGKVIAWATAGHYSVGGLGAYSCWWVDSQGCISVWFDDQGMVVTKEFYDARLRDAPTWFERVKAFLGL